MLDLMMFGAALACGYAAAIYTWPAIKIRINGLSAEVARLRAKAQQLENKLGGR
jgi:outer membrane murein-binding lipoprotein Lpp